MAINYYHGQTIRYIGPRPERDAPRWMDDPCSFGHLHMVWGHVEIFTSSGTKHVQAAHIEAV